MSKTFYNLLFCVLISLNFVFAQNSFKTDTLKTGGTDLLITFIAHGTLLFQYDGKVIHIDPAERYTDYSKMPQADIILVTHHHGDHFDPQAIKTLSKPGTKLFYTSACAEKMADGKVLKNGMSATVENISVKAVPAYNLVHKRPDGRFFHPKGECNGYLLSLDGFKVYVAGDTENIPEMKEWQGVDVAFLPMNLPYTMTPEMVADALDILKPKIFYPYHFGDTNLDDLRVLLKDKSAIDVRYRNMQ